MTTDVNKDCAPIASEVENCPQIILDTKTPYHLITFPLERRCHLRMRFRPYSIQPDFRGNSRIFLLFFLQLNNFRLAVEVLASPEPIKPSLLQPVLQSYC